MTDLLYLARQRATAVWGLLIAATLTSWWIGTHEFGDVSGEAGAAILTISFVKVRFVGLHFMELRDSPLALRALFETYCAGVLAVLVGLLLLS